MPCTATSRATAFRRCEFLAIARAELEPLRDRDAAGGRGDRRDVPGGPAIRRHARGRRNASAPASCCWPRASWTTCRESTAFASCTAERLPLSRTATAGKCATLPLAIYGRGERGLGAVARADGVEPRTSCCARTGRPRSTATVSRASSATASRSAKNASPGSKAATACSSTWSSRTAAASRAARCSSPPASGSDPISSVRLGCEVNEKGTVRTGKYETHPSRRSLRGGRRLARRPMGRRRRGRRRRGRVRDQHRSDPGGSAVTRPSLRIGPSRPAIGHSPIFDWPPDRPVSPRTPVGQRRDWTTVGPAEPIQTGLFPEAAA